MSKAQTTTLAKITLILQPEVGMVHSLHTCHPTDAFVECSGSSGPTGCRTPLRTGVLTTTAQFRSGFQLWDAKRLRQLARYKVLHFQIEDNACGRKFYAKQFLKNIRCRDHGEQRHLKDVLLVSQYCLSSRAKSRNKAINSKRTDRRHDGVDNSHACSYVCCCWAFKGYEIRWCRITVHNSVGRTNTSVFAKTGTQCSLFMRSRTMLLCVVRAYCCRQVSVSLLTRPSQAAGYLWVALLICEECLRHCLAYRLFISAGRH